MVVVLTDRKIYVISLHPSSCHLVARYHRDGVLSLCELHQDDEHRRENKLPAHFGVDGMLLYRLLAVVHGSSYGIANEVQYLATLQLRQSS